jgi:hypothetical protein
MYACIDELIIMYACIDELIMMTMMVIVDDDQGQGDGDC